MSPSTSSSPSLVVILLTLAVSSWWVAQLGGVVGAQPTPTATARTASMSESLSTSEELSMTATYATLSASNPSLSVSEEFSMSLTEPLNVTDSESLSDELSMSASVTPVSTPTATIPATTTLSRPFTETKGTPTNTDTLTGSGGSGTGSTSPSPHTPTRSVSLGTRSATYTPPDTTSVSHTESWTRSSTGTPAATVSRSLSGKSSTLTGETVSPNTHSTSHTPSAVTVSSTGSAFTLSATVTPAPTETPTGKSPSTSLSRSIMTPSFTDSRSITQTPRTESTALTISATVSRNTPSLSRSASMKTISSSYTWTRSHENTHTGEGKNSSSKSDSQTPKTISSSHTTTVSPSALTHTPTASYRSWTPSNSFSPSKGTPSMPTHSPSPSSSRGTWTSTRSDFTGTRTSTGRTTSTTQSPTVSPAATETTSISKRTSSASSTETLTVTPIPTPTTTFIPPRTETTTLSNSKTVSADTFSHSLSPHTNSLSKSHRSQTESRTGPTPTFRTLSLSHTPSVTVKSSTLSPVGTVSRSQTLTPTIRTATKPTLTHTRSGVLSGTHTFSGTTVTSTKNTESSTLTPPETATASFTRSVSGATLSGTDTATVTPPPTPTHSFSETLTAPSSSLSRNTFSVSRSYLSSSLTVSATITPPPTASPSLSTSHSFTITPPETQSTTQTTTLTMTPSALSATMRTGTRSMTFSDTHSIITPSSTDSGTQTHSMSENTFSTTGTFTESKKTVTWTLGSPSRTFSLTGSQLTMSQTMSLSKSLTSETLVPTPSETFTFPTRSWTETPPPTATRSFTATITPPPTETSMPTPSSTDTYSVPTLTESFGNFSKSDNISGSFSLTERTPSQTATLSESGPALDLISPPYPKPIDPSHVAFKVGGAAVGPDGVSGQPDLGGRRRRQGAADQYYFYPKIYAADIRGTGSSVAAISVPGHDASSAAGAKLLKRQIIFHLRGGTFDTEAALQDPQGRFFYNCITLDTTLAPVFGFRSYKLWTAGAITSANLTELEITFPIDPDFLLPSTSTASGQTQQQPELIRIEFSPTCFKYHQKPSPSVHQIVIMPDLTPPKVTEFIFDKEAEKASDIGAATAVTVASSLGAPAISQYLSRTVAALNMMVCRGLDTGLTFFEHPTQISFLPTGSKTGVEVSDDARLAPYFGALVMNLALVTGFFMLHFLVGVMGQLVKDYKLKKRRELAELAAAKTGTSSGGARRSLYAASPYAPEPSSLQWLSKAMTLVCFPAKSVWLLLLFPPCAKCATVIFFTAEEVATLGYATLAFLPWALLLLWIGVVVVRAPAQVQYVPTREIEDHRRRLALAIRTYGPDAVQWAAFSLGAGGQHHLDGSPEPPPQGAQAQAASSPMVKQVLADVRMLEQHLYMRHVQQEAVHPTIAPLPPADIILGGTGTADRNHNNNNNNPHEGGGDSQEMPTPTRGGGGFGGGGFGGGGRPDAIAVDGFDPRAAVFEDLEQNPPAKKQSAIVRFFTHQGAWHDKDGYALGKYTHVFGNFFEDYRLHKYRGFLLFEVLIALSCSILDGLAIAWSLCTGFLIALFVILLLHVLILLYHRPFDISGNNVFFGTLALSQLIIVLVALIATSQEKHSIERQRTMEVAVIMLMIMQWGLLVRALADILSIGYDLWTKCSIGELGTFAEEKQRPGTELQEDPFAGAAIFFDRKYLSPAHSVSTGATLPGQGGMRGLQGAGREAAIVANLMAGIELTDMTRGGAVVENAGDTLLTDIPRPNVMSLRYNNQDRDLRANALAGSSTLANLVAAPAPTAGGGDTPHSDALPVHGDHFAGGGAQLPNIPKPGHQHHSAALPPPVAMAGGAGQRQVSFHMGGGGGGALGSDAGLPPLPLEEPRAQAPTAHEAALRHQQESALRREQRLALGGAEGGENSTVQMDPEELEVDPFTLGRSRSNVSHWFGTSMPPMEEDGLDAMRYGIAAPPRAPTVAAPTSSRTVGELLQEGTVYSSPLASRPEPRRQQSPQQQQQQNPSKDPWADLL